MAQVKKNVARAMHSGDSVKNVLKKAVENEDLTKWDVIKVLLWWAWFKTANAAEWLYNKVLWPCFLSICWVLLLVIGSSIVSIITVATTMTSPIWMPIRLWRAPEKVAKLLLSSTRAKMENPTDFPIFVIESIWWYGTKFMNNWWKPIYSRLPMSHRQWFINEGDKVLDSYDIATQLAYYDVKDQEGKKEAMQKISRETMWQIWNRGNVEDREIVLTKYRLDESYGMMLLNGGKDMLLLLGKYCADKDKLLVPELQLAFVKQLAKEQENEQENAFLILQICAKKRTLENDTLIALINLLGSEVAEKAEKLLKLYWNKNTLSNEVVKVLVEAATSDVVSDAQDRAHKMLMQIVERNNIAPELAELFYNRCNAAQEEEMDTLIKMHMDLQIIDLQCISEDRGFDKLKQYFGLRENIHPEAQRCLREWQYTLYRRTNHLLDADVLNEMLSKILQERDSSYFKVVLDEGIERNVITDTTNKLMLMVPWKRQIVLDTMEATEKEKGYSTL